MSAPEAALSSARAPRLTQMAVAAFDRFSVLNGYQFSVAGPAAYGSAFHLRWSVYVDAGYLAPDDHPDGQFSDQYDQHSTILLAHHRGRAVGTARLIWPCPSTQVLDQYNVELPPHVRLEATAEIGRFAVVRDYRGGSRLAALGLLRLAYAEMCAHGARWWIGNASSSLIRSLRLYCGDVRILPERVPEPHHLAARGLMTGYFTKLQRRVHFFLADLAAIRFTLHNLLHLVRVQANRQTSTL
jgi:hypothetical protein